MENFRKEQYKNIPLINDLINNFGDIDIHKHFDPNILNIYISLNNKGCPIFKENELYEYIKFIDFVDLDNNQYKLISKYINKNNFSPLFDLLDNKNIRDNLLPLLSYDIAKIYPEFTFFEKDWIDYNFDSLLENKSKLLDKYRKASYKYIYYKINKIHCNNENKKKNKNKIITDLLNASCDDELDIVIYLLKNKINKDNIKKESNEYKKIILCIKCSIILACINGHLEIVKYLLEEEKIDIKLYFPNTYNSDDYKIYIKKLRDYTMGDFLICSIRNNRLDIAKYLLNNYVIENINYSLLLNIACREGYINIINYLIERNADPYSISVDSLDYACKEGHISVIEKLIVDYNIKNVNYSYLFEAACKRGYTEILLILINNDVDNSINIHANGDIASKTAIENKHYEIVKILVNSHLNKGEFCLCKSSKQFKSNIINYPDISKYFNKYILHSNTKKISSILNFFIENENAFNSYIDKLLIISSYNGNVEIVNFLIEKGADVLYANNLSLILASNSGKLKCVKILIENNANVGAGDYMSLYLSAINGHESVFKYLIKHGGNINSRDYDSILKKGIKMRKCK